MQNRLEHAYSNVMNTAENLTNAESRIRDVDMAKEMMDFTKMTILMQASQAMLTQANQQPQGTPINKRIKLIRRYIAIFYRCTFL